MIADAKSPGEAAQMLNRKIFPYFKVKYDTTRLRPDQSPTESIASGKATCTGLAILLVDACRAAGIPARVAGTAALPKGSTVLITLSGRGDKDVAQVREIFSRAHA